MEICACYIRNAIQMSYMLRFGLTSTSIAQDPLYSPKPQEVAPIDVYPTSRDHPNVACRMKMLHRDRKSESSIGSAEFGVIIRYISYDMSGQHLYIMQSVVLENLLLASLWSCLGSKLQNRAHRLGRPWFKCLCDTVEFGFMYKTFRTWVICIRGTTSTEVWRLFSILGRNEYSRVKNSCHVIIAEMRFSKLRAFS